MIPMESKEIVRRAIEFDTPPRLPFFLGDFWGERLIQTRTDILNDVCDCWEMDRQKAGWFFDQPEMDDWGCGWEGSDAENMGQVKEHPLADWAKLDSYSPPNPRDPYCAPRRPHPPAPISPPDPRRSGAAGAPSRPPAASCSR